MQKHTLNLTLPSSLHVKAHEATYYLATQICAKPYYSNESIVSVEAVNYILTKNPEPDKRFRHVTVMYLNRLISSRILIGSQLSKRCYLINSASFDVTNTTYSVITYDEFATIINSGLKNTHELLAYFCCLIGSINSAASVTYRGATKKRVVGFQKISYFANTLNIGYRTVIRYNEQLEKLKLIYIRRDSRISTLSDGTVVREPNLYGRYADKPWIDTYADYMEYTRSSKEHPPRRSLAQKYILYRKGKVYSADELKEIKWYAETCNPPKPM